MKKFAIIVGGIIVGGLLLMGGCMAVLGGVASEVDQELDKGTTSGKVSGDGSGAPDQEGKDLTWKGLKVSKDDFGMFEGSLKVTNTTDEAKDVFVEVTPYDGDQTLGSLNGSTKIKPGATTVVDLTSLDDYAKATDYDVEVTGGF